MYVGVCLYLYVGVGTYVVSVGRSFRLQMISHIPCQQQRHGPHGPPRHRRQQGGQAAQAGGLEEEGVEGQDAGDEVAHELLCFVLVFWCVCVCVCVGWCPGGVGIDAYITKLPKNHTQPIIQPNTPPTTTTT